MEVDRVVVIRGDECTDEIRNAVKKIRHLSNPDLLFVHLNLSAPKPKVKGVDIRNQNSQNDIYLAGFSEHILRFIGEIGNKRGQVVHVEGIDKRFNLKPIPKPPLLASPHLVSPRILPPRWRMVRVFISSTFRDMHSERDLLTQVVFPELQRRAKALRIHVLPVDLRWGITEEQACSKRSLQLCLEEVQKCQLFLGILGDRYGWVPSSKWIEDLDDDLKWVGLHPPGASMTELEITYAALSHPREAMNRAFFFIRTPQLIKEIPEELREDFQTQDPNEEQRLERLKVEVRSSGLEVFDGYPAHFAGFSQDGRPKLSGLEAFACRALDVLWNALSRLYSPLQSEEEGKGNGSMLAFQAPFISERQEKYVGRKFVLKETLSQVKRLLRIGGLISVTGSPGSGKTSFLAAISKRLEEEGIVKRIIPLFSDAIVPQIGRDPMAAMSLLFAELLRISQVDPEVIDVSRDPVFAIPELLLALSQNQGKVVIIVDGAWLLRDNWIPSPIPPSAFENQLRLVTTKRAAGSPLYLVLVCEELRLFPSYEQVTSKIHRLGSTIPLLIQDVLSRLEEEYGVETMRFLFSILLVSPKGLMEKELYDLLALKDARISVAAVHEDRSRKDLMGCKITFPALEFLGISHALKAVLQGKADSCYSLVHQDVRDAVTLRYAQVVKSATSSSLVPFHRILAGYYWLEMEEGKTRTGMNPVDHHRLLSLLPYHLCYGEDFSSLAAILTDLRQAYDPYQYLGAKCQASLGSQLMEDFCLPDREKDKRPKMKTGDREKHARFLDDPRIKAFQSFMSSVAGSSPTQWSTGRFLQRALNEPDSSPVSQDAKVLIQKRKQGRHGLSSELILEWITKPQQQEPIELGLSGISESLNCCAVSLDEKEGALGDNRGVLYLYDLVVGHRQHRLVGHGSKITALAYIGPSRLASGSHDGLLCIWDTMAGHRITSIPSAHSSRITAISSSSDFMTFVTVAWDGAIKIWNGDSCTGVSTIRKNAKPFTCAVMHPEKNMLITGGWDGLIKIWELVNYQCKAVLRGHGSSIRGVAIASHGKRLVSTSLDGVVRLWCALQGTCIGVLDSSGSIVSVCFSQDDSLIFTGTQHGLVQAWSSELGRTERIHRTAAGGSPLCVALYGELTAIGYHDGTLRLIQSGRKSWDVKMNLNKFVSYVGFFDASYLVAIAGMSNIYMLLVSKKGFDLRSHVICDFIKSITVSSQTLIIGGMDGSVTMYGLSPESLLEEKEKLFVDGWVTAVAISKDGGLLAAASQDRVITIWEMKKINGKWKVRHRLEGLHGDWIEGMAWAQSRNKDLLLTGSRESSICIFELQRERICHRLHAHSASISSILVQGNIFLSTSTDGKSILWTTAGVQVTCLQGVPDTRPAFLGSLCSQDTPNQDDSRIQCEEMDEDLLSDGEKDQLRKQKELQETLGGGRVAIVRHDGVHLIDVHQASQEKILLGHKSRVGDIHPVGHRGCLSVSDRGSLYVHHVKEKAHEEVSSHSPMTCLDVSWDGIWVASGHEDGKIKVWKRTHEDCISLVSVSDGHIHSVRGIHWIHNAAEEPLLVSVSVGGAINLWKSRTDEIKLACDGFVEGGVIASYFRAWNGGNQGSDGVDRVIILTHSSGKLSLLHVSNVLSPKPTVIVTREWVSALQMSPSGQLWMASSSGGINVSTLERNEIKKERYTLGEAKEIHHWDAVVEAMLSLPDGRIVFGDHDGSICLLGNKGQVLSVVQRGHESAVKDLKILSMDGQGDHFVSIAAREQLIKVWLVLCDSLHLIGEFDRGVEVSCLGVIAHSSQLEILFVTPLDVVKIRLQTQQTEYMKSHKCFLYCNGLMDHLYPCYCNGTNGSMPTSPPASASNKSWFWFLRRAPSPGSFDAMWYSRPGHFNGTIDAFVKIARNEGITSLWSGLPPTLVAAIPTTVLYFTTYDYLKAWLTKKLAAISPFQKPQQVLNLSYHHLHVQDTAFKDSSASFNSLQAVSLSPLPNSLSLWIPLMAGMGARAWATTVVSPFELIRTKMQSKRMKYSHVGDALKLLVKQEGVLGLWKGLFPTLLRDVPFSGLYWLGYESLKAMFMDRYHVLTPTLVFIAGATAGTVAAIVTLPFDVVKTLRQIELGDTDFFSDKPRKSRSTRVIIMQVYEQQGIRGLFTGLIPRIVKVAPACAIMITSYEYGKHLLASYEEQRVWSNKCRSSPKDSLDVRPI
ncbi:unnamed protein product [Darwinula stevensoni]|uniref:DUF4062 domain-containing protein n=1 Tax=Darwinula stevensoni TaxID=69355 RepID=A0A7R8XCH3_9CRUS|nr:unnamed protein product [Darwinula stevensoni]CAG0893789.1 unnamed protein product [Darwinula stevensoni]